MSDTENTPAPVAEKAPEAPAAAAPAAASEAPASRGPRGRGPGSGPRRDGQRGGNSRGPRRDRAPKEEVVSKYTDKVVHINRVAKVVKGGRRFSFSALVVSGDLEGSIGIGYGKAKEVPEAIRKGTERAQQRMVKIELKGPTIPHDVIGESDGGRVILRPASPGTGVIAGGGVRAVLEVIGVKDVLSKSLGSNNQMAMVKATLNGLKKLRSAETIARVRAKA